MGGSIIFFLRNQVAAPIADLDELLITGERSKAERSLFPRNWERVRCCIAVRYGYAFGIAQAAENPGRRVPCREDGTEAIEMVALSSL